MGIKRISINIPEELSNADEIRINLQCAGDTKMQKTGETQKKCGFFEKAACTKASQPGN